jgi:hypothetical protein
LSASGRGDDGGFVDMREMKTVFGEAALSPQDFAALGLDQLAFVKPIIVDGQRAFAIHAADGSKLAVFEDRNSAFVAARRNDLEPVGVN